MTLQQLVLLVRRVLSADFKPAEAEGLVGPAVNHDDSNILILAAKDPNIDLAKLVLEQDGGVTRPSYLSLKFVKPVDINASDLVERYGDYRKGVRLKPTQPIPYSFDVRSHDFPGELSVGYASNDSALRQALTVRIVRMPR